MDTNLYTRVGMSRGRDGDLAVRYTNDANRERVLAKNGHTDIFFLDLQQGERVEDCVCVLLDEVEVLDNFELYDVAATEAERLGFVFKL